MDRQETDSTEKQLSVEHQALHGRVMAAAIKDATKPLYKLERELKKAKHPVLSEVAGDIAFNLDEVTTPWGIEELAAEIEEGITKLQPGYIPTPEMYELDRIVSFARRVGTATRGDLVLAELLSAREAANKRLDESEGDDVALADGGAQVAALHETALAQIARGGVDPKAAAQAALGWRAI